MGRRICQLMVAAMVTALPLVAAVTPAHADNASVLLSLVNTLRAAHGAGPLHADPTLNQVAQGWSVHMAAGAGLVHNPDLGSQVSGGWTKLGENIGAGGNMAAVFNAFVNSPFHLSNMIDPTYNLTGIGVALRPPSTLWVTEDFEAKPGATPVPDPPPATTATTSRPVAAVAPSNHALAPVTAPATTAPPATAPTTAAGTTIAPDVTAAPTDSTPVPSPSESSVPGQLAAATPHGDNGGSLRRLLLTLSVLAAISVSGAGYLMRKRLHGQ